jgi:hypothetical protein
MPMNGRVFERYGSLPGRAFDSVAICFRAPLAPCVASYGKPLRIFACAFIAFAQLYQAGLLNGSGIRLIKLKTIQGGEHEESRDLFASEH